MLPTERLNVSLISPRIVCPFWALQPSGHYMYRQWSLYCVYHRFNIQQFRVLPSQCMYVFCVNLRTNSGDFPELCSRNPECVQPQVGKLSFLASVLKPQHAVSSCVRMFVLRREDFVIQLSLWPRVTCLFAVRSILSVIFVVKTWTRTCTINTHVSVLCMK